jgi:hypothetical protein
MVRIARAAKRLRRSPLLRRLTPIMKFHQIGDLLCGRVHARGDEHGLRRLEQGANVALRVGAQRTRHSSAC